MYLATLHLHLPLGVVDLCEGVAVGLGHFRLAAGPAQKRLDAGEQFLTAERLRDVIVGSR